ncbi:UNVERIFIED_CONTAM: hypothetical protein RMT77_004522 [Armadillidium vulgare]
MSKDIIDITLSPVKRINNSKGSIQSNFKNHTLINDGKLSKLPLQEIEENTMKDTIESTKEKTPRGRRRRKKRLRDTTSAVQSTFKCSDMENYHKNNFDSPNSLKELENKMPASFSKLFSRHEELKMSVSKSRQSFAAYKVSTFFNFNTEFIKEFGDSLSKVEQSIEDMEMSLGKAVAKELKKVNTFEPKNIVNLYTVKDDQSTKEERSPHSSPINDVKRKNQQSSLSKPKEIKSTSSVKKRQPRKRRIDFLDEVDDIDKRERKVRRCTVKSQVTPKLIVETDNISSEFRSSNAKKEKTACQSDDNSDSEDDKEVEYEVRKIQDYVRKQGNFYYQVSWHGYESDEDTYEPADHLDGCDEALTDFFYRRLKEREKIKSVDELKNLPLPSDERIQEFLYKAFEMLVQSIPKSTYEKGIQIVTSKNNSFKTKEELQEDILKFLSMRDPNLDRYKKSYTNIIEQIAFKDLYKDRLKQLADLRAWERNMNVICSDPAPLTVENNVDLALPPLDFVYINEYVPGPNVVIPSIPVAGCECKECSPLQKSCCSNMMGSYFAYNKNGRLRVSLGTPIYECNKACSCSAECTNRVVQNGRKVGLAIFRTSNERGWGVKALEPIKKDQFVCEYVGEVITSEEAENRGMKYDTMGCTYLFDLDYNKGDQNPYTVDAVKYGNVSHFINHSCDPNLVVFNVWVNCLDPDLPKLALFASRDIKKGEEITFDYNSGSTRQISILEKMEGMEDAIKLTPTKQRTNEDGNVIIPTMEFIRKTPKNRVLNAGKTECRCNSANCRKYFF